MAKSKVWDKYAIKAEVHRRGESLTELGVKNGLAKSSCRSALIIPVPAANRLIAKFIGQNVHDLWPDWYHKDGTRISGSGSKISRAQSQETRGVA